MAEFSHIFGCIAGTITTGALLANTVVVNRSSALPCANREIKSAVAGAIRIKSAFSAIDTWETSALFSQTVVATLRPDRACQVALPTKFKEDSVGLVDGATHHKIYKLRYLRQPQEQLHGREGK
ncbi:MAG: hypothetical protein RJB59_440 [Actinomycetota bacterium]